MVLEVGISYWTVGREAVEHTEGSEKFGGFCISLVYVAVTGRAREKKGG